MDKTQSWALKRSATELMEKRDFARASQSWEAAVAQNPADVSALRGFLSNTLNLEKSDRHLFRSAVSQMNWLMRLTETNAIDVNLTAKVCEKFKWHDVAVYYLGNIKNTLPPEAEAVYLKALFHQGRISEFESRFAKSGTRLTDKEIPLYALSLRATGRGAAADNAQRELERAAAGSEHAQLATRLHMIASGEKGDIEAYQRDLQALGLRNEDTVSDHARYWILLSRRGRQDEAKQLANAFTRAPDSSSETVRLADAYFQLGMLEAARELLKKTAPAFAHAPEVWMTYAAVLDRLSDWGGMRAIALKIREDSSGRDTLWGYAYFLEGKAELAEKRLSSADRAFEKAVECSYEIPPLGLAVANGISKLKYGALALRLFQKLEHSFEADPAFWESYFDAAFASQDGAGVLKASERCYQMNPRNVNVHNRYVAALLVNRSKPDEVIKLTVQLVSNFPNSLAAKINHSFALLMNQRTSEALALLDSLNAVGLSVTEASDYHLALFEAYHNLQRWEDAERAAEKIAVRALFPEQRKWLNEKLSQIPTRQIAGKS
ncbi:MAG TPA: tetratricopeptide repeat protein [Candidatus Kapabacteria bacterium]|nr:tetratricopeptide repeat protein [Candidatus Kapabacteria bacterium]